MFAELEGNQSEHALYNRDFVNSFVMNVPSVMFKGRSGNHRRSLQFYG